jgi:hypothetical protein
VKSSSASGGPEKEPEETRACYFVPPFVPHKFIPIMSAPPFLRPHTCFPSSIFSCSFDHNHQLPLPYAPSSHACPFLRHTTGIRASPRAAPGGSSSAEERRNPPSSQTETEEARMSREANERAEVLRQIADRPATDEGEPDREAMIRRKVCRPYFCSIRKL